MLQLAAATGTGMGFKAVTSDLADTVQGMMSLSRNTGLAVEKIRALKHSFAMLTGNGNDAVGFIKKMKQLQFAIDSHTLNEKAYYSGAFSPEKFNAEYKRDPMAAVRYYLDAVNREKDQTLRQQLINATIGQDEKSQAFLNAGVQHLDKSMQSWAQVGRNMPENLDAYTELFIQRMGMLQTQFGQLAESIGSDLYPVINDILGIISDFHQRAPRSIKNTGLWHDGWWHPGRGRINKRPPDAWHCYQIFWFRLCRSCNGGGRLAYGPAGGPCCRYGLHDRTLAG